jgi:hypothetical protein
MTDWSVRGRVARPARIVAPASTDREAAIQLRAGAGRLPGGRRNEPRL